ncbi:MAG: 23S rRNA (adenine(2503)-C(2))-methyltransferase RlmN [Oscillospiraceae bacterium]|nr:23S rRNA (adenine(2503)-C(2))-methyltransferase RlmN [Oscillospiraceae bacterium]
MQQTEKIELLGLLPHELTDALQPLDVPKFRAAQLFRWMHRQKVADFDQMTDLSKQFRADLQQQFYINRPNIAQRLASAIDDTVKYLCRLSDGNCVEAVRMVYRHGVTACISTQVGCRMGCKFCASAPLGLVRNLTAAEMLGQIDLMDAEFPADQAVTSIVLMGIGEPLDNYDQVLRFLRLLSCKEGRAMSLRHVTLSTCGLVPMIDRLAEENLPLTLSVSLHAPDNASRSALMPVNRKYPLEELLAACGRYFRKTGRRLSFEYALIRGENDSRRDAQRLADCLKPVFPGMRPHVNLIPVNPVGENGFQAGSAKQFMQYLSEAGVNATLRRTLGDDIKAACGQLRRNAMEDDSHESRE